MSVSGGAKTPEPEILGPEAASEADPSDVRGRFWPVFRRAARAIPFAPDVVAAYYCALDPQTPHRVRITLMGALTYLVIPLDTVPDFLIGLGFTDDVTVLATAIGLVASHIRPVHRAKATEVLADPPAGPGEAAKPRPQT